MSDSRRRLDHDHGGSCRDESRARRRGHRGTPAGRARSPFMSVSATTVAVRGPRSSSDSSPKYMPGLSLGDLAGCSGGRSRLPSRMRKNSCPGQALVDEHAARLDLDLVGGAGDLLQVLTARAAEKSGTSAKLSRSGWVLGGGHRQCATPYPNRRPRGGSARDGWFHVHETDVQQQLSTFPADGGRDRAVAGREGAPRAAGQRTARPRLLLLEEGEPAARRRRLPGGLGPPAGGPQRPAGPHRCARGPRP